MNKLFIELYLDEDVDVLVRDLVTARGFSVQTTQEAGQRAASDESQLAYCAEHAKTLVSHNRADFEGLDRLYRQEGKKHCGIILAVRRSPYEIAQRLLVILNDVTADEIASQIRYI